MKLATASEIRELDKLAATKYGISGLVLMEIAGLRVVEAVREQCGGHVSGRRILIFAGKGNNGGDALVAARHLINAGAEVKVFLLGKGEEIRGDARANYLILERMGARVYPVLGDKDCQRVDIATLNADLLVDGIYGTGFKGAAMHHVARVIQQINQSGKPVIAIDLPSGLEADSGKVHGPCVRAAVTVTMGLPKPGLYLEPGRSYAGRVVVADISFPAALVEGQYLKGNLITPGMCRGLLPARQPAAHKGSFGHVLVVGGSASMPGAPLLAGRGALRSGAGLVTAGIPRNCHQLVAGRFPEIMTWPLPDNQAGVLTAGAAGTILSEAARWDVLACGMGLGQHQEGAEMVTALMEGWTKPVVLDADALNLLAPNPFVLANARGPVVITPHPGEMARLMGTTPARVQEDRLNAAREAAGRWQVTVVLKGAGTVVACPDGQFYVNTTGNPGMATAGSGDVLAGVIAGLMAQGLSPTAAAVLGVFSHGLAGDLAARTVGMRGMVAGDIAELVAQAMVELENWAEGGELGCDRPGRK